jgi:hypothetical protein
MKHDQYVGFRLPRDLSRALEQERRRLSRERGTELKTSAAIRTILERDLRSQRKVPCSASAPR